MFCRSFLQTQLETFSAVVTMLESLLAVVRQTWMATVRSEYVRYMAVTTTYSYTENRRTYYIKIYSCHSIMR